MPMKPWTEPGPSPLVPSYAEYVSDPAKPVPFVPRPVNMEDRPTWTTWLVRDQRFVDGRTDVLSYTSAPLS
jgi:predicted acyl esterase